MLIKGQKVLQTENNQIIDKADFHFKFPADLPAYMRLLELLAQKNMILNYYPHPEN